MGKPSPHRKVNQGERFDVRQSLLLSERQKESLEAFAAFLGMTANELLRELLDADLDRESSAACDICSHAKAFNALERDDVTGSYVCLTCKHNLDLVREGDQ